MKKKIAVMNRDSVDSTPYWRLMAAIRLQAIRDFAHGLRLCHRRPIWILGLLDAAAFLAFDEMQDGRMGVFQKELQEALKDLSADPDIRRILLRIAEDDAPPNWFAMKNGKSPYPDVKLDRRMGRKIRDRMVLALTRAMRGRRLELHPAKNPEQEA